MEAYGAAPEGGATVRISLPDVDWRDPAPVLLPRAAPQVCVGAIVMPTCAVHQGIPCRSCPDSGARPASHPGGRAGATAAALTCWLSSTMVNGSVWSLHKVVKARYRLARSVFA